MNEGTLSAVVDSFIKHKIIGGYHTHPQQKYSPLAVPSQPFGFHLAGSTARSMPRGIIGLPRVKKPPIDLLSVDRIKHKAVQSRIHHAEVSAFPVPLHLIRELTLAMLSARIFTTPHCREERLYPIAYKVVAELVCVIDMRNHNRVDPKPGVFGSQKFHITLIYKIVTKMLSSFRYTSTGLCPAVKPTWNTAILSPSSLQLTTVDPE